MISANLTKLLNNQIKLESSASMEYLSIAAWAEVKGFNGVSNFFYEHAEEERVHMTKLVKFMCSRGMQAHIPAVGNFSENFGDLHQVFTHFLKSEESVTEHVNEIVSASLTDKDYITHNFMQWYVAEQMEEEDLARNIIDKLNIIGNDKGGLYLFDRDLGTVHLEGKSNSAK